MPQAERSSGVLVIQPIRDWTCCECGATGDLLRMKAAASSSRRQRSRLPSNNACPTRRRDCAAENATTYAGSRSTRTFRPDSRRRSAGSSRVARPIARTLAAHTGVRGSGRVGRSAAGRALDETAITLAVVASLRHQDTDYDSLLMAGLSRDIARERVSRYRPGPGGLDSQAVEAVGLASEARYAILNAAPDL
jgi:hypothetical protein